MDWQETSVLVTGAGGFIGSHLTERLVELGASVRAFLHYNALGSRGWLDSSLHLPKIDVRFGDVCDRNTIRAATDGCQVVFHLAALIAIPYSYLAPASYLRVNAEGTLNVLEACRETGVRQLVNTSTSEVYGTAVRVPIDEEHPLQAQSPYSASKIAAEKMTEAFHRSFDLPVTTVRPFNTFGPRQSARAVIPTIISQCLAAKTNIELGSLSPTRDLNYVSNTVDGFIAVAASDNAIGQTINLGSGREISIGDLARLIVSLTGAKSEVVSTEQRTRPVNSEVERLLADSRKAADLLGWVPRITLEEGLQQTIDWMRRNLGAFRPEEYTR